MGATVAAQCLAKRLGDDYCKHRMRLDDTHTKLWSYGAFTDADARESDSNGGRSTQRPTLRCTRCARWRSSRACWRCCSSRLALSSTTSWRKRGASARGSRRWPSTTRPSRPSPSRAATAPRRQQRRPAPADAGAARARGRPPLPSARRRAPPAACRPRAWCLFDESKKCG
ncbi:hypothetical protein PybrP1_011433 [[Pythium] brassicae (nom. inval.)]|nr:hypothetical protein PybrP1_011433 [[Pythium] brassicae (nom. inval.)]